MRSAPRKRGFTLIEVLVVLGIFAIVAGVVVSVGLHTHSGFSVTDDEDAALAMLQKTRSESMQGVCVSATCSKAVPHGVHIEEKSLVLFEGSAFDPNNIANETFNARSAATSFSGNDIVFAPFSGDALATGTIQIFDNVQLASAITAGSEGQLTYSR